MKNILRDKANYDVLEDFLSTLLESESNQEDESDKFNRVEDEAGDIYVIEM